MPSRSTTRRASTSACRRAGTSGSPRSRGPTGWRGPRSSRTRRRSAPNRPSRLRHRTDLAPGHRRERHHRRPVHGRAEPLGNEGDITFYGSSFVSDPFGRVLVEAPRGADAVLVADLDLDARVEWLRLFPFYLTRRPDLYGGLVQEVDPVRDGHGAREAIRASMAVHS
ncbi:nitrilase-related carbon-nitrogen hydrolase [Curtobacterium flaccumfaciens]|nr:nitrilase-related carbon-nitrogen hydrolase [Curtobacterium flaccumfaciens]